jgi:hypothetical protein
MKLFYMIVDIMLYVVVSGALSVIHIDYNSPIYWIIMGAILVNKLITGNRNETENI